MDCYSTPLPDRSTSGLDGCQNLGSKSNFIVVVYCLKIRIFKWFRTTTRFPSFNAPVETFTPPYIKLKSKSEE